MAWFFGMCGALVVMAASDKATGSPLGFIGLAYLGLCFTLLASIVIKIVSMI